MPGPAHRILMGRIGAAHGIKGEVRIAAFGEDPLSLAGYRRFETDRPGLTVTILAARSAKNIVIARLEGVNDRTAAERLNGVELYLDRAQLPPPEDDDDFYQADLVGLTARLADGTEIGTVTAIPSFGAGDILEVKDRSGDTFLFPFTRRVVPEIHLREGYLVIDPPLDAEPGEEEPGKEEPG